MTPISVFWVFFLPLFPFFRGDGEHGDDKLIFSKHLNGRATLFIAAVINLNTIRNVQHTRRKKTVDVLKEVM